MNKIILAGNPNTGKTTLFNTLTNSFEKASNWHGVTVDVKTKSYKHKSEEFEVCDLPGVYSLSGYSKEEKIANQFLKENCNSLVLNICDANNLERNLMLTIDLIKKGFKVMLVVNMCNEVQLVDYKKLSQILEIEIIEIDARKTKSVNKLKDKISEIINSKKSQNISNISVKQANIGDIMRKSAINKQFNAYKMTDKIDKIVLNKFAFVLIFISCVLAIFYITFGVIGNTISQVFSGILNLLLYNLRKLILCTNINKIILDFIFDGVLGAVVSVLAFVPQIVLLMFFLNLLEDVGFMSRVAFMFDGALKKIGLSGKSLFSLMMGFGCTTSAVLATRNIENKALRKRTIFLLPFMSCSAKLPVFLVLASLFFDRYKFLCVFGLYVFSILISLIFACIYKKIIPDNNNIFMIEMPKYRLPNIKKIAIDIWIVIYDFLLKIGTTILFFSSIIWILQNFSVSLKYLYGGNFEQSLLYFLASKITFLFKPLGLANVGIVCAIIFGVFAKEMVVVGLAMINGLPGASTAQLSASLISSSSVCCFNSVSVVVFLVFVLLYSPCLSSVSAIKNELGTRSAGFVFVFQFLLSYFVAFLTFNLLINSSFIFIVLLILFLALLLNFVLRLKHKKNCRGNCNACRKICC